jgi:ABC-2 type transport system ATP-binding protein
VKAVDDFSFEVRPGEIVGLLGPNGAGKSTTVRIVTGFLSATSGSVEVFGNDVAKYPNEVRRIIGYLPEDNPLYPDMDVLDYLEFTAQLKNVSKANIAARVKEVVGMFGLGQVKHLDIGKLSKGYRQRVGLAQTMVHDPPVLIFDEPTNGLDPNQVLEFREFIGKMGGEKVVIISTHILPEVEALCSRAIIIGKGKILADAPISHLQQKYEGRQEFFLELETPESWTSESVQRKLEDLENVEAVALLSSPDGKRTKTFFIESKRDIDIRRQLFRVCVEYGWTLVDLHRGRVQIEDVFHQLTTAQSE